MFLSRTPKTLAPFLLATLILVSACAPPATQAPPRSTQQPPTTTQSGVSAGPVAGGQLNRFFPASAGGYDRVFTQEKTGFAQANLKEGGKIVAVLSISDTANNPSAVSKFNNSSKRIAGYPAVTQGTTTTAILVGDRFQVKAQSRNTSFTASDREDWLTKFNLSGLARLR